MNPFVQNNIAVVLWKQGKLAEAMELYQEVLRVRVATLGPEHPDVAATYLNMGAACNEMGKYVEAIEYYSSALSIFEKVHGPDHPHVAATYGKYDLFFLIIFCS